MSIAPRTDRLEVLGSNIVQLKTEVMENRMTEEQVPAENQMTPVVTQKKKKASWLRTILWMLSMMLLVNTFFVILFYILYRYKIIP